MKPSELRPMGVMCLVILKTGDDLITQVIGSVPTTSASLFRRNPERLIRKIRREVISKSEKK